jgi:hypothetical protein
MVKTVADITDYLREKIAEFRFARFVGEVVSAFGACFSIVGLLLKVPLLVIVGFPLLLTGLYLTVHYELQRLDYINVLESFARPEK